MTDNEPPDIESLNQAIDDIREWLEYHERIIKIQSEEMQKIQEQNKYAIDHGVIRCPVCKKKIIANPLNLDGRKTNYLNTYCNNCNYRISAEWREGWILLWDKMGTDK